MPAGAEPRSEIYDLGYRTYDGLRLGRGYAIRSLCTQSIRNIFGLGRGTLPKVLAFGLAAIAYLPAIGQLIGGAVGGDDFELVEPHDFYGLIQIVMVLFVAAMASDLVGNDLKDDTLPLYFSRPIERDDYALAKVASMAAALLALTMFPQLLAFIGNWLGASDGADWFGDNATDLVWIIVSALMVSTHLGAVGLVFASSAKRRSFAMVSVLGAFIGTFIAASAVVDLVGRGWGAAVMMLSPLHVMQAVSLNLFNAVPAVRSDSSTGEPEDLVAYVDLPGWSWFAAMAAQIVLAVVFTVHRYRKAS